jgi:hypothetical protein
MPAGRVFVEGFFFKRLQSTRDVARHGPPATEDDRSRAAVVAGQGIPG